MQKYTHMAIFSQCLLLLICLVFLPGQSRGAEPAEPLPLRPGGENPVSETRQAQKEFEQGAKQFEQGAQKAPQKTGQTTWSDLNAAQPGHNQRPQASQDDPRASALQGSPETGYAGTWTDPATGDIITSVIAPAPPQNQSQNYPIIIEPQVSGDWGGGSSHNSYNSYNSGWQNGWPQWPGYLGEPGYGTSPPPPPPPPGGRPPHNWGNWHRPGWPPNGIGPNIVPPFSNAPPHPGYRPLRPYPPRPPFNNGNPPNWNPGGRPPLPPNAGLPGNPPPIPPNWQRPPPKPGPFPPRPGFIPNNPPGWKPLPMRPGGGGWNHPPMPGPQPRGGF